MTRRRSVRVARTAASAPPPGAATSPRSAARGLPELVAPAGPARGPAPPGAGDGGARSRVADVLRAAGDAAVERSRWPGRQALSPRSRTLDGAVLGAGLAVFAVSAVEARRRRVPPPEETVFRALNDRPDQLHVPVWVVMQAGSLGGALGVAAGAWVARRPVTAAGLAVAGTAVWGGAKVIKKGVGRGRPADHLDGVSIRGQKATGLGYPSGHAAISACLATVAFPVLPPWARLAAVGWAAGTAAARLYVGAHLPLDAVGGIGVGVAAGAATNLALGRRTDR